MKRMITLVGGLVLAAGIYAQSTVPMPALSAPVNVYTDANGIPTIVGDTEHDVNFVRGFLHASDRLFQMDYLRRVASGTLAELLGPAALSSDVELRTLGLRRGALETWQQMSADEKDWVKAYADGVNAFLAATDRLPPEYGALELSRVERWSPVDSLIIGKLLAFQLSFDAGAVDRTLRLANYQGVGQAAGFDGTALYFEDLVRSAPMDDRITVPDFFASAGIIPVPAAAGGASTQSAGPSPAAAVGWHNLPQLDQATLDSLADYMARVRRIPLLGTTIGRAENRAGSNWWLVSGEHTDSGYPIMANDPHLGLGMPALMVGENIVIRDEMRVVSGITPPGTPLTLLGCNLNICWGLTNHNIDVTDYFREQILTNSYGLPTHTVHQDGAEQVLYAFQSYFVNHIGDGEMDSVSRANVGYDSGGITFLVPRRNNGPIVAQPDARSAISIQYAGWGATFELASIRGFERAANMEEFQAVIDHWTFGSQNIAYADVEGNIAYFTTGAVPLREDLQNNTVGGGVPPFLLRDGSGGLGHDWLPANEHSPRSAPFAALPRSEMPHEINPARGYIANANNDPVGTTLDNNPLNQLRPGGNGIYYLNPSYADLRMARIDRELADMLAAGPVSVADMKALQANNQMFDAELLVPYILAAFENATAQGAWPGLAQFALDKGIQEAVGRLAAWDFSTPTGLTDGYDAGSPAGTAPSSDEVAHSVAATIYSVWRGQVIANTIDATLDALQLGGFKPGSSDAVRALHHQLASFETSGGFGASGVPFFNVEGAPDMATARDTVLLASLGQSLTLLASDGFAPAFANSTDQNDYRWGKLHRIVFAHPLGVDPFNVPNGGGLSDLGPGLPGVARAGGYQTVDASSHSARADGLNDFMFDSGPARRTVAEMTPGTPSVSEILPGGRSGVLVSPFYTNQLMLWLINDYLPLSFGEADSQAIAVETITFAP